MLMIPEIASIADEALSARLQRRIDSKTKPLGALGRLETLAHRIGTILGTEEPVLHEPQVLVCAADHGLAAKGVSAYPSDVTWQMVENFLAGGAAVSVLARQNGLALTVADCGVAREIPLREHKQGAPRLVSCRVAAGTQDASAGPAMTMVQCEQAIANGRQLVRDMPGNALLLGEMGIGNTSVASLLLARLGGVSLAECTGAGTGLNAAGVARKLQILETALRANVDATAPLQALAALGGFEVAALTGAVLEAAVQRRVIVVDGFITTAAVLVASRLQPAVLERCVFAHRSGEPGHTHMLRLLQGEALLDMGLRLGEGSGAALAWPLLESACVILREMASFESAGVDGSNPA
ncbi:nicotinate-nucleotide--dimethylbenzimidazole phosphoribosyltransferase [Diaphorobacter sp. HDW4A]|uniref:nicotinate-nucleotide--dimethylbenzimidazole phosphoribosyltransferase n=1 Tax=Diaphorobacter sp. HDW4A TaxID=2714924 RepID=UPI00140E394C|nr:nicotinate-nucleotide--dimethylbenzimidazole phosphoribosyltransferase [Diaphorobacter sp. HDW4A]QIL83673.1 nicotinate-nucleotide--dimethylbenzimidazole phosphoribosyltransferase [Diaphorobacter sp. HDW4A]